MWPAPSWASLDWKGNWKALHYMAKRFFAPVLISGVANADTKTVQIHVSNDRKTEQSVTMEYTVTDAQGTTLEQQTFDVTIAPGTSKCVQTVDLNDWIAQRSARDVLVWLRLLVDGEAISEDLALLCRPKHLMLGQPQITASVTSVADGQYDVTLTTDRAAFYVWLELPDAKFSDNFVHLRPNTAKLIRVASQDVAGLQVRSLVDTYA
jgi:beta-mannosidase